jgi:hypothetical protein
LTFTILAGGRPIADLGFINLALYHGVLAPHARWRRGVVAYRRTEGDPAT